MNIPAIWGQVPARNKNFTGRTEILRRLREGLSIQPTAVVPSPDHGNPLPRAVQGLGGVGKTTVAIEYAHRFSSEYDLVWWVPADQLPSVRGSLAVLAAKLRLDLSAEAGTDGAIEAVLEALRRGDPYCRWLLIFDNADQPEDIKGLIPEGTGDVLITSRNHRWQSVVDTVSMDVFERQESIDFLLKRVPRGLSAADTRRLAERLGDLPLALEQSGAMLSEAGMPVDEYLQLLEQGPREIMAEGKSPDYPHTMTGAWKLSVDHLQRSLPQALELLRCCAFFGPEPIPQSVFRRGAQPTGSAVSEVISDPLLMASAIRELGRYALVTLEGASIKVHRLVQALLRDELTPEEQASYRREAHLILATAAPADPDDSKLWPRFRELLPHVDSEYTELPKSRGPAVRDLARSMMRYLYQVGDYASGQAMTERFIEQWSADSGPDSPDVLRAQRHLGNILRLRGRYPDSYRVTEAALRVAQERLGENDATTLQLRASFAADLRAGGRFAQARDLDAESARLFEEEYGQDDSRTLRLRSSLALDHGLNSDYQAACSLYSQAWRQMSPTTSAATSCDVLGAWIGIAWTLRLMGKHEEAYAVSQNALDYGRDPEGLGPEHLCTLRSANAYAIVCRRLPGKRLEALDLSETTYQLASRRFGDNHPDTLAIAISLSNLQRTTDEKFFPEALALAQSAVSCYSLVYGEHHPYYYGCLGNLALLLRVTGDPAQAREVDQRALAGLSDTLGANHHFTLSVAMNLASDFAVLEQPQEARQVGEQTLSGLTSLLGDDHPHTLGCAANLALDLIVAGEETAGQSLRENTLRLYEVTQGRDFLDYRVVAAGRRLDSDFDPPPI